MPALVAAGISPADPAVRRAVRWLEAHQNADGGWGERPALLRRRRLARARNVDRLADGLGAARAARGGGALAGGRSRRRLARRDAARDGDWDEPEFTGTGFPGDFYINYHLYRLVFPMMALGTPSAAGARRSPADGCSDPPDAHGRELSAAPEADRALEVPADRRAGAALRLQSRLRGLRQDPAPARGAEAPHERRGRRARRSTNAARRWCRSPGASR